MGEEKREIERLQQGQSGMDPHPEGPYVHYFVHQAALERERERSASLLAALDEEEKLLNRRAGLDEERIEDDSYSLVSQAAAAVRATVHRDCADRLQSILSAHRGEK